MSAQPIDFEAFNQEASKAALEDTLAKELKEAKAEAKAAGDRLKAVTSRIVELYPELGAATTTVIRGPFKATVKSTIKVDQTKARKYLAENPATAGFFKLSVSVADYPRLVGAKFAKIGTSKPSIGLAGEVDEED